MALRLIRFCLACILGCALTGSALATPAPGMFRLTLDDIVTPSISVARVLLEVELGERSSGRIRIGRLDVQGHSWRDIQVRCPDLRWEPTSIACHNGFLELGKGEKWPLDLDYRPQQGRVRIALRPGHGEQWRADMRWGAGWTLDVAVAHGELKRLAPWFEKDQPRPTMGWLDGTLRVGKAAQGMDLKADIRLSQTGFSDASGLHAGERVDLALNLAGHEAKGRWDWRCDASWLDGEVFWNPLYLAAKGQKIEARGYADARQLGVDQAVLTAPALGMVRAEGIWDRAGKQLESAHVQAEKLDLAALFASFARPFLDRSVLAKAEATGVVSVEGRFADGQVTALDVVLANASLSDPEGRFELRGLNLKLPWRAQSAAEATLGLTGAKLLSLDIGAFNTAIHLQDRKIAVPRLVVPVLDGTLKLDDFRAEATDKGWQWEFHGGVTPISMERLSAALRWPRMQGSLAGVIPLVHYGEGRLAMDGALLVKAFDGTTVIQDLVLLDPLGRAPRMQANIDMRNLDLDLLTRAFSFGSMLGRVDVMVKGMELSNWKPVAFEASVRGSLGSYPRKISQRAVQNISALGGAGAAAAIQRSFLGIFEEFGYSRIGLSCVLRNGVCLMDGVEAAPGGYVIVKGGGIPAITVIGYNRSVGWDELLARLKRVTQGNAKPVIQ